MIASKSLRSPATAYIVASKRTPFGAYGGKLSGFTAAHLGGLASKAAINSLESSSDVVKEIKHTIFGNVHASDNSAAYLARHVGHHAGLPVTTPALTVNRLCGSGFQSITNAVQEITSGDGDLILTGGTESMSMAPYTLHGVRFGGGKYGVDLKLVDSLAAALTDMYPTPTPMGITAENLATKYGITREECDQFALRSQQRWQKANEEGAFKDEIEPVEVKVKKATETFSLDEHPRAKTTIESLQKLPSVFKKEGTVTAGNASGICDGAGANIVASESALKDYGLKPLARIVSYSYTACEPSIMGIGPVEGIKLALKRAGMTLDQMDLIEVNEAFAAQALSVQKELEIPDEKFNIHGGAIAVGHPLGASGARITASTVHNLRRLGKKYAVVSACVGGGMSNTIVLEAC